MASGSDGQGGRPERESAFIQQPHFEPCQRTTVLETIYKREMESVMETVNIQLYCDPCKREERDVIAVAFCEDCPEYFCVNCLQYHQKFRATREHATITLDGDQPQIGPAGMLLGNELSAEKKHCKLVRDVQYSVSHDSDIHCYITDIQILSNDGFLICDHKNRKVKLLDKDFRIKTSLSLDKEPRRAALLSGKSAVVTCPTEKEMIFITIGDDTLSRQDDRTIPFDKQCHDVVLFKGLLYVSFSDNPGNSEIRVLDLRGLPVKVIPGTHTFQYPYYIACVSNGIYVADREVNKLSFVPFSGKTLAWDAEGMKNLQGFLLDEKHNVYICSSRTNKIQVVDANLQDSKLMFRGKDHDEYFTAMVYRGSDQRLIVGCYNDDGSIQTFKFV